MNDLLIQGIIPLTILAQICVLLWYFAIQIPSFILGFVGLQPRTRVILPLLLLFSLIIRFWIVPSTHRIYFDEDRYLGPAVSYARFGKAVNINLATTNSILMGETDFAVRLTIPTIHALLLRTFGFHEQVLFLFAKILSTLQILLIFLLARYLTRSEANALLASVIYALLPLPMFWSTSIGLDSYFVFFMLLSSVAVFRWREHPTIPSLLFVTASMYCLIFVRLEAIMSIPIFILACISQGTQSSIKQIVQTNRALLIVCFILILIRGVISFSVIGKTWCCGDATPLEAFQMGYFLRHLIPNTSSFFTRPELPLLITMSAIFAFSKKCSGSLFLGSWFITFFVLYSTYFAGLFFTVEYSGSYGRYALILLPPFAIAGAEGLLRVERWLRQRMPNPLHSNILIVIVLLLTTFPTWSRYPKLITKSPYEAYVDRGPEQVHRYLEEVILPNTETNAVIVHSLTSVIVLENRSSIYFASALYHETAQDFLREALQQKRPVYMIQTYTCETFPEKCTELFRIAQADTVPLADTTGNGFELLRLRGRTQ